MPIGSHIAVVGAGAIGSYFGVRLARSGRDVTLIGRQSHVDAIRRNKLHFESAGIDEQIDVKASADIATIADADLILFCVKSLDTETTAEQMAPHLARHAIVLSMQNGVDNADRMRRHLAHLVLPVVVYAATNIPAPGHVRHTGGGQLIVGQTDVSDEIAALFGTAGVPVRIVADINVDLWTKLTMNCAYNAICALSGARYGRMVAMPEMREVMRDVVREVVQVANAKGIRLAAGIIEDAIRLADAMPETMSSTAQDIAKGKPTEIDHLNGTVARQGEALGIATPLNRALHALVKLLEQTKQPS